MALNQPAPDQLADNTAATNFPPKAADSCQPNPELIKLLRRLSARPRRKTKGAFGGKARSNHVRGAKRGKRS